MQVRPDRQEGSGRSLEGASLPGRNEQTEGFHDTADLVRKLCCDTDQPRTCRDKRAGCLIAAEASSIYFLSGDAAGCMVVFAVDISRRMMELRGTSLQCGRLLHGHESAKDVRVV